METKKNVFVVGKWIDDNNTWTVEGIYSEEAKAVNRCENINYFVGPVPLDEDLPKETLDWPGLYYPDFNE